MCGTSQQELYCLLPCSSLLASDDLTFLTSACSSDVPNSAGGLVCDWRAGREGDGAPAPEGPTSAISSPGTICPEVGKRTCLVSLLCLSSTCKLIAFSRHIDVLPVMPPAFRHLSHRVLAQPWRLWSETCRNDVSEEIPPCMQGCSRRGPRGD